MIEDLGIFFGPNRPFNVEAVLAGGMKVWGIFDRAYGDDMGVASTDPRFTCQLAEVLSVPVGAEVVIGMERFRVAVREPDGTGVISFKLEEIT
ncbi:MAG: hypothetical protein A2V88_00660 [Elusimicrobia bacterium RBG_16_66_12]|nr:MAG: hypothetical protein A2V88_00660 [Elusimicrobia bacterium RBG_16_66_12]